MIQLMMGTRPSWYRFYGGEDIGAIVRGGSLVCDNPFDHIFTGPQIFDNDFTEEIDSLSSKKEDPDHGGDNVCSTASSPRASEHEKFASLSPKREYEESSTPKEIAVKSEANDESPSTKICPSPKPAGLKRRRNQERSMVCVPMAEGSWNKQGGAGVASDLWSWRKYGQKPIKGSPYPRGYYRCSSSKGCPARKQVERSRTDPSMLLITYTADHNHASPSHRRAAARYSSSHAHNSISKPHDEDDDEDDDKKENSVELSSVCVREHNNHDEKLSPHINEGGEEMEVATPTPTPTPNYSENCLHNSMLHEDQQLLITAHNNHVFHDDLFHTFGDFPSFSQSDFSRRCEEEENCTMLDPFNLFDSSFSPTNAWHNS